MEKSFDGVDWSKVTYSEQPGAEGLFNHEVDDVDEVLPPVLVKNPVVGAAHNPAAEPVQDPVVEGLAKSLQLVQESLREERMQNERRWDAMKRQNERSIDRALSAMEEMMKRQQEQLDRLTPQPFDFSTPLESRYPRPPQTESRPEPLKVHKESLPEPAVPPKESAPEPAVRPKANNTSPAVIPPQRVYRKERIPAKFDGTTSWDDFLTQFKACQQYNQWNDKEASFHLFASCTGEALTALTVNEIQPDDFTYAELVAVMTREFGPRECAESYFLELSRREQQPGETLYQLGQAIRRLTMLAYPKTDKKERDRVARENFKKGIADPDVRRDVFRVRPETLNDAIQTAIETESYYRAERSRGSGVTRKLPIYARTAGVPIEDPTPSREQELQERVAALETLVKKMSTKEQSDSRRSTKCYACGLPGHFARECTVSGNQSGPTQRAMGRPAHQNPSGPNRQSSAVDRLINEKNQHKNQTTHINNTQ